VIVPRGFDEAKVLFLCTGNSARSQMAEGYLRHVAGDRFTAISAGIEPKGLNQLAVEAMSEIGIDISKQTSKDVVTLLGQVTHLSLRTFDGNEKQDQQTGERPLRYRSP
jgi:arsenate reductase (thioredoxin)